MEPTNANRSQLFTLRLWEEQIDREHKEMRMQVQHVLSGEVRYFRAWPALVAFLERRIRDTNVGAEERREHQVDNTIW